jgi:CRISPR-associated protein Cas2
MRMLLFYDLPSVTSDDSRVYTVFHKYLVKNGFLMLQESIYCKLVLNGTAAEAVAEGIRKNKPPDGLVQLLSITEKQFARIEFIIGERKCDVIDTDERLVII